MKKYRPQTFRPHDLKPPVVAVPKASILLDDSMAPSTPDGVMRRDRLGTAICKPKTKMVKVTFRDEILPGKQLQDTYNVESYKSHNFGVYHDIIQLDYFAGTDNFSTASRSSDSVNSEDKEAR